MTSKPLPWDATLIPVDLDHEDQRSILYAQRKICGWGETNIPIWDAHIKSGHRAMFWIAFPSSSPAATGIATKPALDFIPHPANGGSEKVLLVGHVALDRIDVPSEDSLTGDTTLTAEDGSVLTIATLFVMPEFKVHGLGSFAMTECERLAQEEPYGSLNCRAISVNTLSDRHCGNGVDGKDGLDMFPSLGLPTPARSNVGWFEKQGYVRYKEEKRYKAYTTDGKTIIVWAVYLKKELPPRK